MPEQEPSMRLPKTSRFTWQSELQEWPGSRVAPTGFCDEHEGPPTKAQPYKPADFAPHVRKEDEYRRALGASRKTASLNDEMDFDHVVQVLPGGQVVDAHGMWAPELYDGEVGSGWTLMDGYSGQSGYSGPLMHASEFIGGQMERDILAEPGYYVALVNSDPDDDGDESSEWAVAYKPS